MKITPVRGGPNRLIGGQVGMPPGSEPSPDCCDPVTDADIPDRADADEGAYATKPETSASGDRWAGAAAVTDNGTDAWFDGSDATVFTINAAAQAIWDAGSAVEVDEIRIKWNGGAQSDRIIIAGSNSASGPWTDVLDETGLQSEVGYPQSDLTWPITPATYRYWRITAITGNSDIGSIEGNGPDALIWVPAWNVIDGDDATYEQVQSGTEAVRIDLGAAFRIVRSRVRIGSENAGSRTYTIKGANLPDFSDEDTLASVTFTATGSYTAQDVDFLWATTESYRYFELSGTTENRRVYTWELFESTPGSIIVEDPTNGGALDDLQDVLDNIYAEAGVTDHGGLTGLSDDDHPQYVRATDGGGEVLSTVASSGTTETIDLANGNVHDVTLTDDCTFTFTSPAAGRARSFTLVLRQGASPPHTATWPGSVVWPGGVAPTLSTTLAAVDVLTFFTLDGGTVWFGFAAGDGGGDPATTVESETTFGISPAVGSDTEYARQDHTHGTPPTTAVRDAGRWEVVVSGTGPPVAVSTPDDDDWVYAWVT